MPAATSKTELLDVTTKEFAKLERLIDGLDPSTTTVPDDEDTSIKDVIAHRAHWIGLFLGWYHAGAAGEEVHFPAEGYRWNELKRYNADLRARQRELGWDDARRQLVDAHGELLEFLDGHTDDELYGGPMAGARNDWTPGRWAEAAGASHYRSAGRYIRARLRELGDS